MVALTMLVSLASDEPQEKGRVGANLSVGNDRARLLDVLTQHFPFVRAGTPLRALGRRARGRPRRARWPGSSRSEGPKSPWAANCAIDRERQGALPEGHSQGLPGR